MPTLNRIFHHGTAVVSVVIMAPNNVKGEDLTAALEDTIAELQSALIDVKAIILSQEDK